MFYIQDLRGRPPSGRFGGPGTLWVPLQESFSFAHAARHNRAAWAKEGDLRGRQAAPKPPPRNACKILMRNCRAERRECKGFADQRQGYVNVPLIGFGEAGLPETFLSGGVAQVADPRAPKC